MVMMMLNIKDKKKKQIFFKILKEYNASFLFKEYFLKTHNNNNITLDELFKKETNQPIYNILSRAFVLSNIDNPNLWHNIHHEMVKYEFGEFINHVAIKNKLTKEITPLHLSLPF